MARGQGIDVIKFSSTNDIEPAVRKAKPVKKRLADYVNAVDAHPAITPEIPFDKRYTRWIKVPDLKSKTTVSQVPSVFSGTICLEQGEYMLPVEYPYNQEKYMATTHIGYGFGIGFSNDPEEAVLKSFQDMEKDFDPKLWKQALLEAEQELAKQLPLKARKYSATSQSKRTPFTNLRPKSKGRLNVLAEDFGNFISAQPQDPYDYRGDHYHSFKILDFKEAGKAKGFSTKSDQEEFDCPRFFDEAENIFFVVGLDEGPLADYYEGHYHYPTFEGAFADQESAKAFQTFLEQNKSLDFDISEYEIWS